MIISKIRILGFQLINHIVNLKIIFHFRNLIRNLNVLQNLIANDGEIKNYHLPIIAKNAID